MADRTERILSAEAAAKIIYNTDRPSPEQVGKIRLRLMNGQLQGTSEGTATTTARAVAEYMARVAASQQSKERDPDLSGFYGDLLRDYFHAVVTRRKLDNRSSEFRRSVVIGQVLGLLFLVSLLGGACYWTFVESAEKTAVRQFLQQEYGDITVRKWHKTQTTPVPNEFMVKVEFSYVPKKGPGKLQAAIATEQAFLVRDGVAASSNVGSGGGTAIETATDGTIPKYSSE